MIGKFKCKLPDFPQSYEGHSLVANNSNELLVLGGMIPNEDANLDCLIYRNNRWVHHSKLNEPKFFSCAVTMPDGIYIFGERIYETLGSAFKSTTSIEFLPNEKSEWKKLNTTFPGVGLQFGRGVAISMDEILFTGGTDNISHFRRIVKFDTKSLTWSSFGSLIHGRNSHSSFAFKDKVIVCGGWAYDSEVVTVSTEIIDLHSKEIKEAGNLNEARSDHGMGILKIGNTRKLVAFGGVDAKSNLLSSVEAWNEDNLSWEMTDIRMPLCSGGFSYLSSKDLELLD